MYAIHKESTLSAPWQSIKSSAPLTAIDAKSVDSAALKQISRSAGLHSNVIQELFSYSLKESNFITVIHGFKLNYDDVINDLVPEILRTFPFRGAVVEKLSGSMVNIWFAKSIFPIQIVDLINLNRLLTRYSDFVHIRSIYATKKPSESYTFHFYTRGAETSLFVCKKNSPDEQIKVVTYGRNSGEVECQKTRIEWESELEEFIQNYLNKDKLNLSV